jgi:LuxR family maltose regulon positive regulatory protein
LVTRGLRGPLTLLAAPAGWGKTTLLGAWWAEAAGPAGALTWVSLDPRDNDPARFWTYVIAALQTAHPAVGGAARSLLRSPRAPPLEALLTTLLNELTRVSGDTVLVLDDYHAIENVTIHESLTFFLDHLPPRLHVVISTRADPLLPLARWRARGVMAELRADDLRFTSDEASAFLSQAFGLAVDARTIAALEARTEGWIAGLQLAALAMRDHADPAGFVGAFTGSHRFVADYLAEEVLQRQPPAVQDFLLRTSILDRLCAPLCQALAEDAGSPGTEGAQEAQRQLERLDRANLFLIPLDGERRWYRYHHLFADLLRARLQQEHPELVRGLHGRASGWFERSGFVAEAVQHALAAGEFARAAALLEPVADPLWMGGQMATLRGWLADLPGEVLRAHPRLLIGQAAALFFLASHQIGAIEAMLREAEAALGPGEPAGRAPAGSAAGELDHLAGRVVAIRASQASWQGDTRRTIALAREALERLGPDEPTWRVVALTALGMAYALRGEPGAAIPPLGEATRLSLGPATSYIALGARLWLGIVRVVQGELGEAGALFRQGLAQVGQQGGENLTTANFLVGLGFWVDYERNDLETAERHLAEGVRLAGRQQWPWVLVDAYATLARIKLWRGEGEAAGELLRRMDLHAREVECPWPWMAPRVAAAMAQACLAFGQVERAAEWAARFDLSGTDDLASSVEVQRTTAARLLVAQGRPARALNELDQLLPGAEGHGRWGRVVEIQALRAVALEGLGQGEGALAALGRALALAEPGGYVRRFVDEGPTMQALLTRALRRGPAPAYVATLLRAFGEAVEPGPPASAQAPSATGSIAAARGPERLAEPLSARERDVLRLLVAGRSGPEIAGALVVAPSTVKTHLKSIYGKLDVHSRDQAIARARELQLR